LYDSQGELVAWQDGNQLRNQDGDALFWIDSKGNVFDYEADYKGIWEHHHWRGLDGGVVVFREDASETGVTLPYLAGPPSPEPMAVPEPMLRPGATPGKRPLRRSEWSTYQPFQ
jgi:hypothetical protein